MKKIVFLSPGHWAPSQQSPTRSARDAFLEALDLSVAAEELGMDGAYFQVHHFARQFASPFPLLSAVGAKTKNIEIGTAVIDMRYENAFHMAENAGAADLISNGRLQLGLSRRSPEPVIDGWRYFGDGTTDADMGRQHAEIFFNLLKGDGFAEANPSTLFSNRSDLLRIEPHSEGLRRRVWWGASSNSEAVWAAKLGMNLQSCAPGNGEPGEIFHIRQAAQIRAYRQAWKDAGHAWTPRVSVNRSIFILMNDHDRAYFESACPVAGSIHHLDYAGEPEALVKQLVEDRAIMEADTLLFAMPNQFGIAYDIRLLETILKNIAPVLGWR